MKTLERSKALLKILEKRDSKTPGLKERIERVKREIMEMESHGQ